MASIAKIIPIIGITFESSGPLVAKPIIENIRAIIPKIRPITNPIIITLKTKAIIPKMKPNNPTVLTNFFHLFFPFLLNLVFK